MSPKDGSNRPCALCQDSDASWTGAGRPWKFMGECMCVNAFRDMTGISKKIMIKHLHLAMI